MIRFAGRACRLPMAPDVTAFAELLYAGRTAVTQIPEDRWRHAPFYHPVPGTPGRTYSFAAGVVEGIDLFDPAVFGISPREAAYMDPQQRLFLQVVWEALEDACLKPSELAGKDIGVFAGASLMDYGAGLGHDPQAADGYAMSGASLAVIANRVSHVFDWHGPSMTVDTACSSSLFALKAALRALESGEVEIAVVGATNALLLPSQFVGFAAARMLSPTGLCQAFGAGADGYVRGEGAVAFVLVRDEAGARLSPQDRGRLLHVETNTSGQTVHIALPSARAQRALLEAAYDRSGIDPDRLAFVEAHGTGTAAGDPVEAEALGLALGQRRASALPIGSVKTNIGHLEPAAGSAGLLKALVALERRELPPSLHAPDLNPAIPFDRLNLDLVRQRRPLAPETPLAGVSSFGFGGANAHAILAAPAPVTEAAPDQPVAHSIHLASAFCREALRATLSDQTARLFDASGRPNDRLLAEALHHRDLHPVRAALLADTPAQLAGAMAALEAGKAHPALEQASTRLVGAQPVFVFSGNGAQYAGMSRAAYAGSAAYRAAYDRVDEAWQAEAGWSLVEKIQAEDLEAEITDAPVSQPLLFADQAATALALMARGLRPAAVLGHSAGEVAAAFVSGALDLASAVRLIHARATSQHALAGQGSMAALQLGEDEARAALRDHEDPRIEIAAVNSPRSVTLTGPRGALEAFGRHARRNLRAACLPLRVNYPFHSSAQEAVKEDLLTRLGVLHPAPGAVPIFSSVAGGPLVGGDLDSFYWWRNMRQPVQFQRAVQAAAAAGHRLFLEVGPDPVLAAYLRDTLSETEGLGEVAVLHSLARKDGVAPDPLDRVLARLLVHGAEVDRTALAPRPEGPSRELRHYPWQLQPHTAADTPELLRSRGRTGYHPLLGQQSDASATLWRAEMDPELQPAFADHRVGGRCLLPGTALAEMALAAGLAHLGAERLSLRDFDMTAALPLTPRSMAEVRTEIAPADRRLRILSRPRWSQEAWRQHGTGRLTAPADPQVEPAAPPPDPACLQDDWPGHRIYALGREIGLTYGAGFRTLARYRRTATDSVEVLLRDHRPEGYDPADYALDPIGADGVLHGLLGLLQEGPLADQGLAFVPTRIARLDLLRPGCRLTAGRLRLSRQGVRSLRVDLDLFDATGLVARLHRLELRALRVIQPIDIETHAFFLASEPLAVIRDTTPWPSLPALADRLAATAPAAEAIPEEALLLLDALAQRIAWDALSAQPEGAGAPKQGPLMAALRRLAAPLGPDPQHPLPEVCDLPEARILIAGISQEYPVLIPEVAALARLAEAVPHWVRTGPPAATEEALGRGTLEALCNGTSVAGERADWLAGQVAALLQEIPVLPGRRLVLLELAEGAPPVLSRLRASLDRPDTALWALDSARSDRVPPELAGGIGRIGPAQIAELGAVDLLLGCGAGLDPVTDARGLAALKPCLGTGGSVLLAEQCPRPHVTLLRLLEDHGPAATARPLQGGEGLIEAAGAAGLAEARALTLDLAGGTTLLLARPSASAEVEPEEEKADEPQVSTDALPVEEAVPSAAQSRLAEALATGCAAEGTPPLQEISGAEGPGPLLLLCAPPDASGEDPVADVSARLLALAQRLRREEAQGARAIWVICPQGAGARDLPPPQPTQAALWAALRSAKNEYPAFTFHAVDPAGLTPAAAAAQILALVAAGSEETELVLTAAGPRALRVRLGGDATPPPAPAAALTADTTGGLDRLRWCPQPLPEPGPGQVRLAVTAAGLNYRDVMWSMGLLPEEALEEGFAGPGLGLECAGRVEALGEGVTGLAPGDAVASFGPACLSSHMVTDAAWLLPLPPGLSPEEAATIPVAFFTAFYALEHLGRLRPGETVLIHGGAGGVGLAAIQIAQWRGARVVASAGTEAKRAYLRALGVEHVVSSRSPDFDDQLRAQVGGVDLVLNALAGEAMERSLALLNPFGRFLELGKVDFYANTGIGLRPLKDNITYHGVDIDRLLRHDPALSRDLFARVMQLFRDGLLAPLPLRAFEARDTEEAFRLMQRSGHLGKIVLRPPALPLRAAPSQPDRYRPGGRGVSLVAGGGSGLGLELAARLVRGGARRVAVLGRSARPGLALRLEMARARDLGAEIRYLPCDIADRAALDRTLASLRAWGPLDLVVNSAMVLDDMRLGDLTPEVLARVLPAKIAGTRNLDLATRDDAPGQFVVFSSMATLIGNHGQGAYVAANAWVETLMRQRRSEGLPALAVGWGAIHDCGYLTRDRDTAQVLNRFGGSVDFSVRQALRVLDELMAPGQQILTDPVIWVSPMSWAGPAASLRLLRSPTHRLLQALGQQASEGPEGDDLREGLIALPAEAAEKRLTAFLRREVARILRVPESGLSPRRPVAEFGVDSLMGIELGLAAQQALGDDIPLMAISDAQSMEEIARRIVAHLQGGATGHALSDLAGLHLGRSAGEAPQAEPGRGEAEGPGKMEAAE